MALNQTPLHARHKELGGRMVPFAGWEMPVQYSSIIDEHTAVREKAGLFDVSHMGEIIVKGQKAAEFLDKLTCNNVADMQDQQVRYNAVPHDNGGLMDDITIYRVNTEEFFVVSNASNYERVYTHFADHAARYGVGVKNESDDWHLIAVQGPLAENILCAVLGAENGARVRETRYYRFCDINLNGGLTRVSRTGYTGEDGFEIYSPVSDGVKLWDQLLETGRGQGLLPAGLGARDSLRLEAFYPLYGHELSDDWSPVESGIGWIAKEKDAPYPGYERIMKHKADGVQGRVCGLRLLEPGVPREGYRVFDADEKTELGKVLSGGFSPVLKAGIGSVFLPIGHVEKDREIRLEVRGRMLKAAVHTGPFVKGGAGAKK